MKDLRKAALVLMALIPSAILAETCPNPATLEFHVRHEGDREYRNWTAPGGWKLIVQYPPIEVIHGTEDAKRYAAFQSAVWNPGGAMVYHTGVQCNYIVSRGAVHHHASLGNFKTMYATISEEEVGSGRVRNWSETSTRYRTCRASWGSCTFDNH